MTYDDDESSNNDGLRAVVEAGEALAEPELLEPGSVYSVVVPAGGKVELLDLTGDQYLESPRRKVGKITLHDATSFLAYWDKHHVDESELYADIDATTVTAVIDAHTGSGEGEGAHGLAGWRKHTAQLSVRKTPSWLAWEALDGERLEQQPFAEHIEDHLLDIVEPSSADMLELAQSFHATTNAEFQSTQMLTGSERALVYKETVDATAGRNQQLTIPNTFTLGLAPFEGSETIPVVARLRFRIIQGHLRLWYQLDRPDIVLRTAFDSVLEAIEHHVDVPVLRGVPGPFASS